LSREGLISKHNLEHRGKLFGYAKWWCRTSYQLSSKRRIKVLQRGLMTSVSKRP